ncbi:MAG: 4-carboxy-4-hydroxy-2-oxoadipate aldolase/oxaloacetate decarboxylase, partial [Microbacterium sp.]|nr:4-carboxy-4-hydroxy-2-oxoadipate aldolase/oxaloacetate decarboxylase [Microbacterium sp.]
NVPISLAGQIVYPGDAVLADDDGVVIVPRARVAEVVKASRLREEKEALARDRYLSGEIALDVNDMRDLIKAAGVQYVEYEDWQKGRTS